MFMIPSRTLLINLLRNGQYSELQYSVVVYDVRIV